MLTGFIISLNCVIDLGQIHNFAMSVLYFRSIDPSYLRIHTDSTPAVRCELPETGVIISRITCFTNFESTKS